MRVLIGIASIPQRERCLRLTLESLAGQVGGQGKIHVYLNGHVDYPEWRMDFPGVGFTLWTRSFKGDLGDAGKFFRVGNDNYDYYIACDDDIIYPPTFVRDMIAAVDRYQRRAVVGLHGWDAKPNQRSYHRDRARTIHYGAGLPRGAGYQLGFDIPDVPMHVIATNSCCFHRSTLPDLRLEDFRRPNMADLWFSMHCNARNVPRVVLARPEGYMQNCRHYNRSETIWARHSRSPEREAFQTETLNTVGWGYGDLEGLKKAA